MRPRRRRLASILPLVLLAATACRDRGGRAVGGAGEPATGIEAALAEPARVLVGRWTARSDLQRELVRFYEGRGAGPAWSLGRRLRPAARELLARLGDARAVGLEPGDYRVERLAALVRLLGSGTVRRRDLLDADPLLTAAALLYASDLSSGRLAPEGTGLPWFVDKPRRRLAPELAAALERGELDRWLDAIEPHTTLYRGQLEMLERYRAIADGGGWPRVPEGPVLEAGDPVERSRLLPLLERLAVADDLAEVDRGLLARLRQEPRHGAGLYHARLAAAVARFQQRHGLEADGKLGPETVAALDVPAVQRVRQIVANLERARWLGRGFPERYVHVNVPAFRLQAFDGGRPVLEMPIVVGRADWMTPLFRDRIASVEINPYWNVPESIAARELLPEAREDLDAFLAQGYEVLSGWGGEAVPVDPRSVDWSRLDAETLDLRFRQRPGPTNALGDVKFLFPNRHNVYLHDTPADRAFARSDRALSHGCIRVARPLDLAAWVFAEQEGWDRERVEEAIASGDHVAVALEHPIPVYILYWTAWMEDGRAQFRDDVYGIDATLERSLERRTVLATPRVAG